MIRVLLVDDHPVVRAGYARLIEQAGDMHVVAEAGSAEEACALCRDAPLADVVVSDIAMPGIGGIELIRRLRARWPRCRVLVFSMYDGDALVQRAREAGAMGFMSKSSAPQRLVQAVRAVHAGRMWFDAGRDSGMRPDADRLAALTEREFALFRLLAEGHSAADCAGMLNLSAKTVSNHQTTIRDKLGVGTSAAMTHLALRSGVIAAPTD